MSLVTTAPRTVAAAGIALAPHNRRQRRWAHRAPCVLRLMGCAALDECPLRGETVNMSPGGLALQVGESVPPGTVVEAVIARPHDEELLVIRGRVVHSRRVLTGLYEVGVSIVGSEPAP